MRFSDLARRRLTIATLAVLLAVAGAPQPLARLRLLAGADPARDWSARVESASVELGVAGVRLVLRWTAEQLR